MSTLLTEVGLLSYDSFQNKFNNWVKDGSTSSTNPTPDKIAFTKLNWSRSQRIHHTIDLSETLKMETSKLTHTYSWIVLTEAWCGDSAQNLPVIAEIAKLNPNKIKLYILLRDENLAFMDNYLTNGSMAIPKLVCIDETINKERFIWGPRPAAAQELLTQWKRDPGGKSWNDFEKELHSWYAKNKTQDIQKEFESLLNGLI